MLHRKAGNRGIWVQDFPWGNNLCKRLFLPPFQLPLPPCRATEIRIRARRMTVNLTAKSCCCCCLGFLLAETLNRFCCNSLAAQGGILGFICPLICHVAGRFHPTAIRNSWALHKGCRKEEMWWAHGSDQQAPTGHCCYSPKRPRLCWVLAITNFFKNIM